MEEDDEVLTKEQTDELLGGYSPMGNSQNEGENDPRVTLITATGESQMTKAINVSKDVHNSQSYGTHRRTQDSINTGTEIHDTFRGPGTARLAILSS